MYTNLINITNNIQNKQDILYKDICKIKTIIDIDNNTHSGVSSPDNDSSDEENIIPQNYVTLPIQNHITFPHYWIFNDTNFKQIRLPHNKYEVRIFGNNLRLISNELAKFLKIKKEHVWNLMRGINMYTNTFKIMKLLIFVTIKNYVNYLVYLKMKIMNLPMYH